MFTKSEVHEFLAQYSTDNIDGVLKKLGFTDECNSYPDDIVEQVEKVFNVVDNTSKALPDGTKAIMLRDGVAIAQAELMDMGIEIPPATLIELLRPVVDSRVQIAQVINAVASNALIAEIEKGQQDTYQDVAQYYERRAAEIEQTFTPENIKKIVKALRPKTERKPLPKIEPDKFDLDKFLAEHIKPIDYDQKN